MEAGYIYIKTRLDNTELEKKDIPELEKELENVSTKTSSKLALGFSKVGSIAKGLLGTLAKISGVIVGIVGKLALIGGLIGGLALIGTILSEAFKKVFEENSQVKADLDYMRWVIVNALAPAVELVVAGFKRVVEWLVKALYYIGYIIKAWTGYDIFKNSSVDNYAKSLKEGEKATKKTQKNIAQIKKQLVGFDEANVLHDMATGGVDAGTNKIETPKLPSFDFTTLDMEIPDWIKWIAEHGNDVAKILLAIAGGIVAIKLGATGLQGLIVAGVIIEIFNALEQIQNIIGFFKDPSIKNFVKILRGIVKLSGLLGIVLDLILEKLGFWDWLEPQLEGILKWLEETWNTLSTMAGNIWTIITGVVEGIWNSIVEWLSPIVEWIDTTIIQPIISVVSGLWTTITSTIQTGWNNIKTFIGGIVGWIEEYIINPIKENIDTAWKDIQILFDFIVKWISEHIIQPIKDKIEDVRKWIDEKVNWIKENVIEPLKKTLEEKINWFKNTFIEPAKRFIDGLITKITTAIGTAKKKFDEIKKYIQEKFIEPIKEKLGEFGTKAGNIIASAFKVVINGVLTLVEKFMNAPIKAINGLIGVIQKIPGLDKLEKLSEFNFPRLKLAKGGIVNMPNKGVPVGNAITGERGAEGVIPLTDSQQMELLGEAIGKYITINANIINKMNGRVISREVQRIQNEEDFAYNRG